MYVQCFQIEESTSIVVFQRVYLLAPVVLFLELSSRYSGWPVMATSISVLCLPECSFEVL